MTEKYTPEKVAELVAEANRANPPWDDDLVGDLIADLADALTAVSAELRRATWQFQDAENANADNMKFAQESQADRDRLHKAITEALRMADAKLYATVHRILRAALDKEGKTNE